MDLIWQALAMVIWAAVFARAAMLMRASSHRLEPAGRR